MRKYIYALAAIAGIVALAMIHTNNLNAKNHVQIETDHVIGQFRPCVWPNTCKTSSDVVQFTTCVWPKTCVKKPA